MNKQKPGTAYVITALCLVVLVLSHFFLADIPAATVPRADLSDHMQTTQHSLAPIHAETAISRDTTFDALIKQELGTHPVSFLDVCLTLYLVCFALLHLNKKSKKTAKVYRLLI